MKKKFSVEQIVSVLKPGEVGVPVAKLIRKVGITEQTDYRWKAKYTGLEVDQVRQIKQLRDENTRLKRLVAELTLDKTELQAIPGQSDDGDLHGARVDASDVYDNLSDKSKFQNTGSLNAEEQKALAGGYGPAVQERDSESGNDYFGAGYYASAMGRFTSPDWSAKIVPVPYAKLGNPQSLNLYAYVENNPLTRFDPDGHIDCSGKNAQGVGCQAIAKWNADHGIS